MFKNHQSRRRSTFSIAEQIADKNPNSALLQIHIAKKNVDKVRNLSEKHQNHVTKAIRGLGFELITARGSRAVKIAAQINNMASSK